MNRGIAGRVLMPKTACKKSRVSVPLTLFCELSGYRAADYQIIFLATGISIIGLANKENCRISDKELKSSDYQIPDLKKNFVCPALLNS